MYKINVGTCAFRSECSWYSKYTLSTMLHQVPEHNGALHKHNDVHVYTPLCNDFYSSSVCIYLCLTDIVKQIQINIPSDKK